MKKSVTLARALKEKNRIAGRLRVVRALISTYNSCDETTEKRIIDVLETMEEAAHLEEALVEVKTAIALANRELVERIIRMEELKSEIAWYNGIPTKEGVSYNNKGEPCGRITVVISETDKLKAFDEMQKKINNLQDELDAFNATHRVSIEVDE